MRGYAVHAAAALVHQAIRGSPRSRPWPALPPPAPASARPRPGVDDRQPWRHGGHPRRAGAATAAMVRHQHHIRLQCRRRRLQQHLLGRAADIARQQDHAMTAGDAQHATVFILSLPAARCRVQHLEVDTVPLPAHPLLAGRGSGDGAAGRRHQLQPRQLPAQARQAAGVVQMVMAEHRPLRRPLPQRTQHRHQDPFIAIASGRRPHVPPGHRRRRPAAATRTHPAAPPALPSAAPRPATTSPAGAVPTAAGPAN